MAFATAPDGASLFYQATSLVPPWRKEAGVVLMHHGVGLSGDAWMDWQPALLAADYRVIRIDLRGFGRSEVPALGYKWSLPNFFADMNAVLAVEKVDKFHFVGESIGGMIGLAYAARHRAAAFGCRWRVNSLRVAATRVSVDMNSPSALINDAVRNNSSSEASPNRADSMSHNG